MKYAAVIYDRLNIVVKVEERPSEERANKAGEFFVGRNSGWWYQVVAGEENIEMYKAMINL